MIILTLKSGRKAYTGTLEKISNYIYISTINGFHFLIKNSDIIKIETML